ncbi:hypothetical protein ACH5RR_031257 [Cinchona calisaya]|uniref:Uncharacterized protein n=1 Tax=Cinchona calisaya TaxID=153742 RepID=A0ABD2YI55_9GENT
MYGRSEKQLQHKVSQNMDSLHAESKKKGKTELPISYLDESKKENLSVPLTSVHLLKSYYESKLMCKQSSSTPSTSSISYKELSTDGILKLARERLLQCTTPNFDVVPLVLSDLFYTNSGVSSEKNEDFELALLLQAAALKFSDQQLGRARKLLNICLTSASLTGNALHRIVYYYSVALQERITREIGGLVVPREPEENQRKPTVEEALTILQPALLECQNEIPFSQVTKFTSIQAIMDNVASAKRVHFVDLGIKSGSHWPILMQALAGRHECPLELLRISAVGLSKETIDKTGKTLSSFADAMNIPFAFKLIVSDLKDLKEDFFELASDEVLAVYSEIRLSSLLPWPHHLESLLRTIAKLNPCVMVITEPEANTSTPVFLDRFDAALSLCSTIFDCLEDCMHRDNPCRNVIEGVFIWEAIRNVITTEGEERIHRKQKLDFWRAFLARVGIVEIGLSDLAWCQSNLVVKSNPRWSSCTVEANGKGMIIGWKGTPIQSLSVWKFHHE